MKKILISILMSSLLWGCAHINGLAMPAANSTCPDNFPIKGNADSYIYHTYDSPHYQMVNPEVCFANEDSKIELISSGSCWLNQWILD